MTSLSMMSREDPEAVHRVRVITASNITTRERNRILPSDEEVAQRLQDDLLSSYDVDDWNTTSTINSFENPRRRRPHSSNRLSVLSNNRSFLSNKKAKTTTLQTQSVHVSTMPSDCCECGHSLSIFPETHDHEFTYSVNNDTSILKMVTCPISLSVFINPISLSCGHTFERAGLSLVSNKKCPECRTSFSVVNTSQPNIISKTIADNLLVLCPHGVCNFECKRSLLPTHLKECPHKPTPCTNYGCLERITLHQYKTHVEDKCEFRSFVCPNKGCQKFTLTMKDEEQHALTCTKRLVKCHLCPEEMLADVRSVHLREFHHDRGSIAVSSAPMTTTSLDNPYDAERQKMQEIMNIRLLKAGIQRWKTPLEEVLSAAAADRRDKTDFTFLDKFSFTSVKLPNGKFDGCISYLNYCISVFRNDMKGALRINKSILKEIDAAAKQTTLNCTAEKYQLLKELEWIVSKDVLVAQPLAYCLLAYMYFNNNWIADPIFPYSTLLLKAAQSNCLIGQYLYYKLVPCVDDIEEADGLRFIRLAADGGHMDAQYAYHKKIQSMNKPVNLANPLIYLELSADQGCELAIQERDKIII